MNIKYIGHPIIRIVPRFLTIFRHFTLIISYITYTTNLPSHLPIYTPIPKQ